MEKKRIRKRHIVLAVLLVLLIALASLVFWQRENIKALLDYTNYSKEELEEQLKQNDQTIKDAVGAIPEVTVRDITEEEREALKNGELSQQELIDSLVGKEAPVTEQPKEPSSKPSESPNQEVNNDTDNTSEPVPDKETEPIPEQSDYEKRLSELVAEVYVLREEYLIALDELLGEAKTVYKSTPEAQRTGSWLADMVSSYLAKGTALEKECDRRMDAIVTEMKTLIKDNNGDMYLVDEIIETYANEKRLKKAWYMSRLEEKGLI